MGEETVESRRGGGRRSMAPVELGIVSYTSPGDSSGTGTSVTTPPAPTFLLRLYVAGQTEMTQLAVTRLTSLCESRIPGRYELEVIDVAERPDLADQERILVIPTVVRVVPAPQRRVIGDLTDDVRTAAALGFPDPYQIAMERRRS